MAHLEGFVRGRMADAAPLDPIARPVVDWLRWPRHGGVAALAAHLDLSERQLHRRATDTFGYGPATLARVLRLQRFVRLASGGGAGPGLASLAAAAGYYDQAHLSRDVRALGGTTPAALVRAMADPSNTAGDDRATVSGTTTPDPWSA
jgi:AraC-like DNA-binding protein